MGQVVIDHTGSPQECIADEVNAKNGTSRSFAEVSGTSVSATHENIEAAPM